VTQKAKLAAHGGEEGVPLVVVWQPKVELDGDVGLDVDGGVRVDEDWEDGVGGAGRRAEAGARAGGRRGGGIRRHGAGSDDWHRERGRRCSLGAARPEGGANRGAARPGGAVDVRAGQRRT